MDFNQAPYFDDFDADKQYYKVLFKPGVAVQTRELNQLQTILQNQVTKFGNHVFKEGSMVIPGQVNYNDKVVYVKIASTNLQGEDLTWLEEQILTTNNDGEGVEAAVIKAVPATDTGDPITLIVLYTSSNQDDFGNNEKEFTAGSTLYVKDNVSYTVTVQGGEGVTGRSAVAAQQAGVYYLGGYFVSVPQTTVVVEKYVTNVSAINARIGIVYTDEIITYEDDDTLLDNAAGTSNIAAPGADRYKISTDFIKLGLNESRENFFELIRIENGVIQQIINGSQYNILEEALAERTFDESGNYVVRDFDFDVRESRNNYRGTWLANTQYLVGDYILASASTTRYYSCVQSGISGLGTEPAEFQTYDETQSLLDGSARWRYINRPSNNLGYYDRGTSLVTVGNSSQIVLTFGAGRAYIQGFKVDKLAGTALTLNKSRDTRSENNRIIATNIGNYAYFDPQHTLGMADISTGPVAEFYDRVIGDTTVPIGYGNRVGSGRIIFIDSGTQGAYKIGFNNIIMNAGKSFERDVNLILVPDPAGSILSKSYQQTGNIRYVGADSGGSSYVQISGGAMMQPNLSPANDPLSLLSSGGLPGSTFYYGQGGDRNRLWQSFGYLREIANSSGATSLPSAASGIYSYGKYYSGNLTYYQGSTGYTAWAWASSDMRLVGRNTAFSRELLVGETLTLNTSSNSTSWTVSQVLSETTASLVGGTIINRYTTTGWSNYITGSSFTTINPGGSVTGVLRSNSTTGILTNRALSSLTIGAALDNAAQIAAAFGSVRFNVSAGVAGSGAFSSQLSIGSIVAFCDADSGIPWTGGSGAPNANLLGTAGNQTAGAGIAYFIEGGAVPDTGYSYADVSNSTATGVRAQAFRYQSSTGTWNVAGNLSSYLVIGWGADGQGVTLVGGSVPSALATSGMIVLLRGTASNPVPSSWTGANVADTTTSAYVRVAAGTVFGVGTGTSTRFLSETLDDQVLYLGTANQNNTTKIRRIISENRMLVENSTSVAYTSLTLINASTSTQVVSTYGSWYTGVTASFASEVFDSFALGINAQRMSGQYQLLDYTGSTGTAAVHTALRIVGDGTSKFTQELRENDLVKINNNRIFITHISSNSVAFGISMDSSITGSTSQFPMLRITNGVYETEKNTLLFKVADGLASMTDNSYYVYKSQQVSGVNGALSVTITLDGAPSGTLNPEQLASNNPASFLVAEDTVGSLRTPATVTAVTQGATPVEYVLTVASAFQSDRVRVIYPVLRSAVGALVLGGKKEKTLVFDEADTFLTSSEVVRGNIVLNHADVYRINKILMATTFVSSWTTAVQNSALNITSKYILDDGQRDNIYDLSRIILRSGQATPIGSIKVWYDYFDHGTGDFFAGTSYNALQIPFENIPTYKGRNLNDYLDFRARVDLSTNQLIGNRPPRIDSNFQTDLSFYLGRKEAILLDRQGRFYNIPSVPARTPRDPEVVKNNSNLHMYSLTLEPYTRGTEAPFITQTRKEYRRYTMADIAGIDKRVASLEEISSLNLLETGTKSLQIRDNADPTLERYKTGFFVDSFIDNSGCELESDSNFSNETTTKTLKPAVVQRNFDLIEKINFSGAVLSGLEQQPILAARALDNYRITGETVTLNYTTSVILQQVMATTNISVAPFLQANFIGSLALTPDSDVWQSTTTVNKSVGEGTSFTQADVNAAIARLRATGERRPIQVNSTTTETTVGTEVVVTEYPFCRANTIAMVATGLKAKTKHYVFFGEEAIGEYVTGAMKFTFDSVANLNFTESIAGRNEFAKWRSIGEAFWVNEPYKTIYVRRNRGGKWGGTYWEAQTLYQYVKKQFFPNQNELVLPGTHRGDAYRHCFDRGRSVYHYANGAYQGSGVAMYQKNTTLYCLNSRGSMSRAFMKNQPLVNNDRSYNYPGVFYVAVDQNDPKQLASTSFLSQMQTSDDQGNLYSDADGVIVALFDLPNNDVIKFLSGEKKIVITDNADNDPDEATSRAEATFTSRGIQLNITRSYVTNRSFSIRPYDPIAQSFKLPDQYASGAFITDIDVFFQAKPVSQNAPVTMEIRPCDASGRPDGSGEILPGSEVIKFPNDIVVDASTGRTPTKFTFKNPVYLLPNKNYAFVLRTDSVNYRVWVATLGQVDLSNTSTTTRTYSRQALLGSFFKSQDGTLWTEDQLTDMKFNMSRAVFNINNTGIFRTVNNALPAEQLTDEPLMFVHGSNKIRVKHINHGHAPGDKVRLSSKYWATQYTANSSITLNGIPVSEIFGSTITTEDIVRDTDTPLSVTANDIIDQDYYIIQTTTPANLGSVATTGVSSVMGGGDDVVATYNQLYHAATPASKILNFQETTLTFDADQTTGFTYDSTMPATTGRVYSRTTNRLNFSNTNFMNEPKIVLSSPNEYARAVGANIGGGTGSTIWPESFVGTFTLTSTNDAVSPAIDLSNLSVQTWQWRIDTPTRDNRIPTILPAIGSAFTGSTQFVDFDEVVLDNTSISFDGINETINTTVPYLFYDVAPGSYIVVSGSSIAGNNSTSTGIRVKDVNEDGTIIYVDGNLTSRGAGDSISIYTIRDFIDERAYGGASANSKYITRQINLENPATSIKMLIDANIPSPASFDVYYKIGTTSENFKAKPWVAFTELPNYNKEDQRNVYSELQIDITDFDELGNARDLPEFTAFQVKIVMKTTNGARYPSFRNLRIIAHA